MTLRKGLKSDVKDIGTIGYKAFRHFFETDSNRGELLPYIDVAFSEKSIIEEFESNKNEFLLAKEDGVIIGFARLWEQKIGQLKGKALKMERLYLLPEKVGTGAGAFLMDKSIEYAKEKGYDKLWLQVFRPNIKAIQFYTKWGFSEFNTSPAKFEADNEIDLWMMKDL